MNKKNTNTNTNPIENEIDELSGEATLIYKLFNKRNKESIVKVSNDKLKLNINHEKDFKLHLQKKLNKLNNRSSILQIKYKNYKKWYDRSNILIIVLSSILSIFEALRIELKDFIDEDSNNSEVYFNMIPIGISSTITCTAAIIKFKKYQEKMENMQSTREKVIVAISKLKAVQESLWFNEDHEFESIKQSYLSETYDVYNESNSHLDRHINFDDPIKFKNISNITLEKNKNKK